MYVGAGAFLIAVGIILMAAPRDTTRTLPLDLIGAVLIAAGAIGLLTNVFHRLRRLRARRHLKRTGAPVTTFSAPTRRPRHIR